MLQHSWQVNQDINNTLMKLGRLDDFVFEKKNDLTHIHFCKD